MMSGSTHDDFIESNEYTVWRRGNGIVELWNAGKPADGLLLFKTTSHDEACLFRHQRIAEDLARSGRMGPGVIKGDDNSVWLRDSGTVEMYVPGCVPPDGRLLFRSADAKEAIAFRDRKIAEYKRNDVGMLACASCKTGGGFYYGQMCGSCKRGQLVQERPAVTQDAINPAHYKDIGIEPIAAIESWGLGFCLGNCVKYIARAGRKGDRLEDLKKARWYLEREIANLEAGNAG